MNKIIGLIQTGNKIVASNTAGKTCKGSNKIATGAIRLLARMGWVGVCGGCSQSHRVDPKTYKVLPHVAH